MAGESIAKSSAMAVGAAIGELLGGWAGGAIGAIGGPAAPLRFLSVPLLEVCSVVLVVKHLVDGCLALSLKELVDRLVLVKFGMKIMNGSSGQSRLSSMSSSGHKLVKV